MNISKRRTGNEEFHSNGTTHQSSLIDFWRWADSNLRNNATRGRLAEYIVAMAIKAVTDVRHEWVPYDLTHPSGITIEVKSAAYVQSWEQRRPSSINFDIAPTTAWDPDTAKFAPPPPRRQAKVYVFALQGEQDEDAMDPLNLAQWQFFVLATTTLNNRVKDQKTITLSSLLKLEPSKVSFEGIDAAIVSESKR